MTTQPQRLAQAIGLVFAGLLHAIVGYFHLLAGLTTPWWAWLGLLLEWALLAGLIWRWRTRPMVVLVIPFASAAVWWAVVVGLGSLLDWTA